MTVRLDVRFPMLLVLFGLGGCVAGSTSGPPMVDLLDGGDDADGGEPTPSEPIGDALPEGFEEGYGDDELSIFEGDGWGMADEPLIADPSGDEMDDGDPVPLSYGGGDGVGFGAANPGHGGGARIADPCRYPRRSGYNVKIGTQGPDRLRGTNGPDLIFGLGGDDVIWGLGGNDVICAGGGADRVYGGHGRDYIDAGLGRDYVHGGPDGDVIHGRNGGDRLRGGPGDDWISGDLLDDFLFGDDGDDVLIGGHGTDYHHGGDGADYMRGDTGHDTFVGGTGVDTVSFMTATPPGQPRNDMEATVTQDGMLVDLSDNLCGTPEGDLQRVGWMDCPVENRWDGLASGDGFREAIRGVERVVGSAFDDLLIGGSTTTSLMGGEGNDSLQGAMEMAGGPGADLCNGAPCEGAAEGPSRTGDAYVTVDNRPDDLGLVVIGAVGAADDTFQIEMDFARVVRVTSDVGRVLTPGPGCESGDQPHVVICNPPEALRYVLGYGGDGNDHLRIGDGFARDMTAHLDGGFGDDVLDGGDGEDILFAGRSGVDALFGHSGDDALISESRGADRALAGDAYPGGADLLDGGLGNDQIVADYPCGGHRFRGGKGVDIAGFARSPDLPIYAQLGGEWDDPKEYRGHAYNPDRCGFVAYGTQLDPGLEILEGADGADRLFGNRGPNVIWGWGGNDFIGGDGGPDVLEGHLDNDDLDGGEGADVMRGNRGFDTLHAVDGRADAQLSCGGGDEPTAGGRLHRDPSDPAGTACGE